MALGPLPDVANVVRFKYSGLVSSRPFVALFFWHYNGAAPSTAQLNTFCTALGAAWNTHLAPVHGTFVTLQTTQAWDLASRNGAAGTATTAFAGTRTGAAMPAQVCGVASWSVNYRWRGGHFRTYFPMGVSADTTNMFQWTTAARTTMNTQISAWLTAVNGLTVGGTGGYLTGVRYVRTNQTTDQPEYIIPPLDLPIGSVLVDSRIDTQRRRLGKDVSS